MRRENNMMSMLHKQVKCNEDFVSEKRKQEAFCDNIKPDKYPFLEYEEISSLNKLDRAFDILFEEITKKQKD